MEQVLLATTKNNIQASMVQDVLENEGIESFMRNEYLSLTYGFVSDFQPEIFVYAKDYEKAYELIKEGFPELA